MSVVEELVLIGLLILANGFFAAAEIAILTARGGRLAQQASSGSRRAQRALELSRHPTVFLSTVQVGITVVGTLAAVFSGATLVGLLARLLEDVPWAWVSHRAEALAVALVVAAISFVSLVFGELVPKRLALGNAEGLATLVAFPLSWLAWVGRPLVALLGVTTDVVLFVLGHRTKDNPSVSLEDIEHLMSTGTQEGLIEPAEHAVAKRALRLGDRTVRDVMRPRIEIDALDIDTPSDEVIGAVAMAGFSRLPVHEGDIDHIVGFVYTKDLLRQQHMGWPIEIRKLVRPALLVPQTLPLDRLLEEFRRRRTQMAIVLDEFGGTEGLVTLEDVLEELVGEIHDEVRLDHDEEIVRRDERHWSVGGAVNLDALLERIGREDLREQAPREFSTLGGLIMAILGRVPATGDQATWNGIVLEVLRMDGPRIDRVLVSTAGGGSETP